MTTVAQALREAATRLAATCDTARLDAELLMAHTLLVSRSDLLLRHMDDPAPESFAGLSSDALRTSRWRTSSGARSSSVASSSSRPAC
jgi:hypothetical protein